MNVSINRKACRNLVYLDASGDVEKAVDGHADRCTSVRTRIGAIGHRTSSKDDGHA